MIKYICTVKNILSPLYYLQIELMPDIQFNSNAVIIFLSKVMNQFANTVLNCNNLQLLKLTTSYQCESHLVQHLTVKFLPSLF